MSSSIPLQVAETVQTASINPTPDPLHDINPSTAASEKLPVTVSPHPSASEHSLDKYAYDDEEGVEDEDDDEEEIPYSVLRPISRKAALPPLPDLRFEQSYLASIANADTTAKVVFITIRDQVLQPLLQGTVLTLGLLGWRHWNRSAQLSGGTWGAKVRRWWYRTNNWPVKENLRKLGKDRKLAAEMGDFYQNQSSSGD